jgi:hypothetical protein
MKMEYKDGDKTYVISPRQIRRLEAMFKLIIIISICGLLVGGYIFWRLDTMNAITLIARGCGG